MLAAGIKAGVIPASDTPVRELFLSWQELVEPISPFLNEVSERLIEQVESFDSEIVPYAKYALSSHGKQIRPALVGLSAGVDGRLNDSHVTVAVIIEMVHLATLVHDDIMDEAEIRRRQPTLAASWGNEISVLVGDCLFAHALKLAASFPTPEVCRAVASATKTVCSGEILQTHQRCDFEVTRSDYFKVLEMKTAELFALSCGLGARLSGASAAAREALREYGIALGTGYQVFDDCLDLFGSETAAGKSLGTDLARGKLTLPMLIVIEKAGAQEIRKLCEVLQRWEPVHLPFVLELAERHDAVPECRRVIFDFLDRARQALEPFPETPSRLALQGLTQFLDQQAAGFRFSS